MVENRFENKQIKDQYVQFKIKYINSIMVSLNLLRYFCRDEFWLEWLLRVDFIYRIKSLVVEYRGWQQKVGVLQKCILGRGKG